MLSRDDIVAEAERWIGTPFHWQGAVRGKGCDCKGLIVGVARDLGLPEAQSVAAAMRAYQTNFPADVMLHGLQQSLIETREPLPGDIMAMEIGFVPGPRHLAIIAHGGRMIHCYGKGPACVISAPIGKSRKVHSYWTWPSLVGMVK